MLFVLSGSFSCIGFFLRPVLTEHTLLFSVQRTRSLGIGLGLGSGGKGGELQDGTLGVWSAGDDEDILGVLGLDGGDDSGGDHEFLPGLGKVDVENTFLVASEDVTFHHLGAIVGSNMDLSGEHVNEILVFVVSV